MGEQLHLFDANEASPGRVVLAIETSLGPFGNRTDLIIVDESNTGGTSFLECDNSDAQYFNHTSKSPYE